MKELLESGVHFGHQTRRWNPRMKPYIFTERGGIYIIDLQQTIKLIDDAYDFIKDITANGGKVLFVGTKKQCQDNIAEEATKAEMPFVSHRWLGGLLTNYQTISLRIKRIHELRRLEEEGQINLLPTREQMSMRSELEKLEKNLGGVADMDKLPGAIFVVDPKREAIVIREARKLHIPIVALVDTNCDPEEVDFVIPGNDDAIRSCGLIIRALTEAALEGKQVLTERELKAGAAAAAKAEEAARVEAAAAAKKAAEEEAAAVAEKAAKATTAKAAPSKPAAKPDTAPKPAKKAATATAVKEKPAAAKTEAKAAADDKKENTGEAAGSTEEKSEV
jgi:small subunit ribosomal protein S2